MGMVGVESAFVTRRTVTVVASKPTAVECKSQKFKRSSSDLPLRYLSSQGLAGRKESVEELARNLWMVLLAGDRAEEQM